MRAPTAMLLLIVGPVLGADKPRGDAGAPAELQGVWMLESVERGGEASERTDRHARIVIKGDRLIYAGEDLAKLSTGKTEPKLFDLQFRQPADRTCEGIYKFEGDTLTVCLNARSDGIRERPEGFSTKDHDDWRLLVFKKDKDGDPAEGLSAFVGLVLRYDADRKQVVVADTLPESPARKAGFKEGDVLVRVGDAQVSDLRSAVLPVRNSKPKAELTLKIERDGKERTVTLKPTVLPFAAIVMLD